MKKRLLIFCLLVIWVLSLGAIDNNEREKELFFVLQKAYEDGIYDICLDYLEEFFQKFPQSPYRVKAKIYQARCLINKNKFPQARQILEGLVKEKVGIEELGEIYYLLGEIGFKTSDYQAAISYYNRVIEDFPDSDFFGPALYSRGWVRYLNKDFKAARDDFLKAKDLIDEDSALQDIYMKLTEVFFELKDADSLDSLKRDYIKKTKSHPLKDYMDFYKAVLLYEDSKLTLAKVIFEKLKDSQDPSVKDHSLYRLGLICLHDNDIIGAEKLLSRIKDPVLKKLLEAYIWTQKEDYSRALECYEQICNRSDVPEYVRGECSLGRANSLYKLGRLKDAVYWYSYTVDNFDKFPQLINQARYNLGWCYLKLQDFKKAIEEFKNISEKTDDPTVKISVDCHIGDAYQDSGKYAQALEIYDRLLEEYPQNIYGDYIQFQIGNTLLKMNRLKEAIMAFRFLEEKYPNSAFLDEAYYSQGLAYFMAADYPQAIEVLNGFLSKFPSSSLRLEALYLLSQAYMNAGDYKKQEDTLRSIINNYSLTQELVQEAIFDMAHLIYTHDNRKKAIRFLKKYLNRLPSEKSQEALFIIGQFCSQDEDFTEAKEYYRKSIEICKDKNLCAEAGFYLASILKDEGKLDEASKLLEKFLEESSSYQGGLKAGFLLAEIFASQADLTKLKGLFSRLEKAFPKNKKQVLIKKAGILRDLNEFKEASEVYQVLEKEFGINSGYVYLDWADCLERLRIYPEALKIYFKIAYLFPDDKEVIFKSYLRIAEIYRRNGNYAQAAKIYRKIEGLGGDYRRVGEEKIKELNTIKERRM